jgi:hypothetical protein
MGTLADSRLEEEVHKLLKKAEKRLKASKTLPEEQQHRVFFDIGCAVVDGILQLYKSCKYDPSCLDRQYEKAMKYLFTCFGYQEGALEKRPIPIVIIP